MFRKPLLLSLFLIAAALFAAAQVGKPPNQPVFSGTLEKRERSDSIRSIHGQVMDPADNPLENAVVQLKNLRNLQVRSFITKPDGTYHFNGLSTNIDYEVRAEHNRVFSSTRTLSALDGRKDATLNIKIDAKKGPKDEKPAAVKKPDDSKKPDDKTTPETKKPTV